MDKRKTFSENKNLLLWILFSIYIILAVATSTQNILISGKPDKNGGLTMKYNNYLIFKYAHFNLVNGANLYKLHHGQAKDYYKYSPAFALLFGILAHFIDFIGLNLWNLINVLVLFFSILLLPGIRGKDKAWILLFIMVELVTTTQNSQSNALIAGLLVMAFALMERKSFFLATLLIVLSIYIKIFGALALIFILFYPGKKKIMAYTLFWSILFFFIPLLVIPWNQLSFLYQQWFDLLRLDQSASVGISVLGILQMLFPSAGIKNSLVVIVGFLVFLFPLIFRIPLIPSDNWIWKKLFIKNRLNESTSSPSPLLLKEKGMGVEVNVGHKDSYSRFKNLSLASILIWIIIFNHKAESATFIIAMTGIAIWYFTGTKGYFNLTLLIIAFIVTSLFSTDILPVEFRDQYIVPYNLKVIPCTLVWFNVLIEMIFTKHQPPQNLELKP